MELRHLRYFVAVAEEENVTRASNRLHVSQPAVSRQIRDLEDEMGVELFARTAQSIGLTDAGRAFLPEAREILARTAAAVRVAQDAAVDPPCRLKIGFSPSPSVEILTQSLREFQIAHPAVLVTLRDMTGCEMAEGVIGDTLDAAIMVQHEAPAGNGLQFEVIRAYRAGVLVPGSHRFARLRRVPVAEVRNEGLVLYSRDEYPGYNQWAAGVLGVKVAALRPVAECDGVTSLIAAVESGRGVAIVIESIVAMCGRRIRFVPLSPAPERLPVGIVFRSNRVSKALREFLAIARRLAGPAA